MRWDYRFESTNGGAQFRTAFLVTACLRHLIVLPRMVTKGTIATEQPGIPAGQANAPGRATTWWPLAVLVAINILNFYDRQVAGALVEPMRKEFHLSDTQIG